MASKRTIPVASNRWTPGGILVVVLIVLAIGVTIVGGLWIRGGGRKAFEPELGVPAAASASDLRAFAAPSRPVYWIGPAQFPDFVKSELVKWTALIKEAGIEPE